MADDGVVPSRSLLRMDYTGRVDLPISCDEWSGVGDSEVKQ